MTFTRSWPLTCALVALTASGAAAQTAAGKATPGQDDHRRGRRVAFTATITTTNQLVFPGAEGYDDACAGRPMSKAVGAGASDLFSVLWVRHSHCAGEAENTAENVPAIPVAGGRFEFVDTKGRTILGQYRGRLVATFNAGFNEIGPWGHWLLQGSACVSGGNRYANIVDDCAADRWAPIRGLVNLDEPSATIHFDQTIGLAR